MTPYEFISKWRLSTLTERSASQQHFLDLCELLDEPKPADADPFGESYCFERGARKDTGGDGWADVWKLHHFAWEYKGKRKDLDAAFGQLRLYALALENPPLLIVSDMLRFRIRTNWTNSVSKTHTIELDDLTDAAARNKLKGAFSNPERLRAGRDPAIAHRAGGRVLRDGRAGVAGARPRPARGRALRQPIRLLHVCRRRGPAAQSHVHADAGAVAADPSAFRRPCRGSVPGDGFRWPSRLRDGRLVQRRAVRRRHGAAAGEIRHRRGADRVGPRLVRGRPVDPRHAVRARSGSRQNAPSLGRTTPIATKSC